MHSLNHNVRKFNQACRGLEEQLSQCGQVFTDGKVFTEEAYLDHPNEQFVRFIQMMQDKDRLNLPGNTGHQLIDKGQAKIDQINEAEQHKQLKIQRWTRSLH
jgi:hypothetical protein